MVNQLNLNSTSLEELKAKAASLPEFVDTTDATATESDMLNGETAYVNGVKVTGNIPSKTSSDLSASGATVTVPAGHYASQATKSVATAARADTTISVTADDTNDKLTITASNNQETGYVTGANKTATKTVTLTTSGATATMSDGTNSVSKSVATATQATPTISVDANGKITSSATQTAGYVSAGTKSATPVQMTTQAAKTVTPTKSSQTAVASGRYTTGAVTVAAIPDKYIDTTDATATAQDMVAGVTAYVNGEKITGEGDPDLIPSNIPSGIEIFGTTGTRPHYTENMMLSVSSNLDTGEVTATNGTDTVTGTLSNGEVFLTVPSDGTWTVNGTSGDRVADEGTGSLKGSDNVSLIFFEATVGCYVMGDVSTTVTCTNGTTTYTSTGTGAHYFTVYERGTWTVSATIDGQEWTYNANVQTHKAKYIEIFNGAPDATLDNNPWTLISVISSTGLAANYWAVGDTKEITINGTVGMTTFDNLSIWAFILGFNHNPTYEGESSIHFQIGKSAQTSGKNLCLIDSKYGSSVSSTAGYFNMNYSNSNSGGWASSKMRTVLLGSQYDPNSPLSGSLLAALDADLRGAMKACTKYSDNTGGGSNTASYVTATTDYLWLLSEREVQGARSYANSAEQNYQQRYDYYANGNSRVFYRHSANTSTASWWLRSTRATSSNVFCIVYTSGSASSHNAYNSFGVAPAFCV